MIVCCRLLPVSQKLQLSHRFYARKKVFTSDATMKQVHQQTLRYVCPDANIKIDSDINIKVCSADPHKFPNGDALIAKLLGGPVNNCTASMVINISNDERNVEVALKKLTESTDFHCELEVPVKAALDINTRGAAAVNYTYGDELKVWAKKNINIENVRADKINLLSSEGDINCLGLLLGNSINLETRDKGNIILDKLQGNEIKCKTALGNITTNCSYVDSSEFQTHTGNMDLKNVHKKTVVRVLQKGDLKMTGVHGKLKVLMNEGTMNLHLSKLEGESAIEANNLTSCVINISEDVESSTSLNVNLNGNSSFISLDRTLEHLSLSLAENKQQFKTNVQNKSNKLNVISSSSLVLAKSSWMDMICLQMAEKEKNKSYKNKNK